MSSRQLTLVWQVRGVSASEKAVLARLADLSNDDGECWPGQAKLGEDVGLSDRSVRRIIDRLEAAGLVSTVRVGKRRTNRYLLTLSGQNVSGGDSDPEEDEPVGIPVDDVKVIGHPRPVTDDGDRTSTSGGDRTPVSYPPKKGPVRYTRQIDPKSARDEIWDALVDVFGDPTTDTNRTLRGKVAQSLFVAEADGQEILRRASMWPAHFPDATLTETALEKHWDRLGRPPLRMSADDTAAHLRRQELAQLERQLETGR